MSDSVPSVDIDFGTTNSSMAWYDPRSGRAEVIKNQGEDKTPSMVYFGEDETLVGKPVDELIEDVSNDRARREEEEDEHRRRVVEVPDLSGQNVFQASGTLANSGLTLGAQEEVPSEVVAEARL
jgi:molecular chaperone DnaK (HSP70)